MGGMDLRGGLVTGSVDCQSNCGWSLIKTDEKYKDGGC